MTSQCQSTLIENLVGPSGFFSFAGWHRVKLCQWRALERRCQEEGAFFPCWFWHASLRQTGSCSAQRPAAPPSIPPGASGETSLHKWLSLASQKVGFEQVWISSKSLHLQRDMTSLLLSEARLCKVHYSQLVFSFSFSSILHLTLNFAFHIRTKSIIRFPGMQ